MVVVVVVVVVVAAAADLVRVGVGVGGKVAVGLGARQGPARWKPLNTEILPLLLRRSKALNANQVGQSNSKPSPSAPPSMLTLGCCSEATKLPPEFS